MHYTKTQKTRQLRIEGDRKGEYVLATCEILVECGDKQILHVIGKKVDAPAGADVGFKYDYGAIIAFPADGTTDKYRTLSKRRMHRCRWDEIALAVFKHLGCEFPIDMINKDRTLVIEETGQITMPVAEPNGQQPAGERPVSAIVTPSQSYDAEVEAARQTLDRAIQGLVEAKLNAAIRQLSQGLGGTGTK